MEVAIEVVAMVVPDNIEHFTNIRTMYCKFAMSI